MTEPQHPQSLGEQVAGLAARISGGVRRALDLPTREQAAEADRILDRERALMHAPPDVRQAVEAAEAAGYTLPVPPAQPHEPTIAVSHDPCVDAALGLPPGVHAVQVTVTEPLDYHLYVTRAIAGLNTAAADLGPAGLLAAAASLRLALAGLRQAEHQTSPSRTPVGEPAELGEVVQNIGDVFAQLDAVLDVVQRQLAAAYTSGEWTGPPASTATTEVEAVMRELTYVVEALATCTSRIDHAGHQLRRLTRINPQNS
jgi:hypothetical protein